MTPAEPTKGMTVYELLTRKQVAERLSVSPRTLDKLRTQAGFPAPIQFTSKTIRWRADHIDAWIGAQSEPQQTRRRGGRRYSAAELMA